MMSDDPLAYYKELREQEDGMIDQLGKIQAEAKKVLKEQRAEQGRKILVDNLLVGMEWVLKFSVYYVDRMKIELITETLTPALEQRAKELRDVGFQSYDSLSLNDNGWELTIRARHVGGATLTHAWTDDMDVEAVMKSLHNMGVRVIRTGSLRSDFYKARKRADRLKAFIDEAETQFKQKGD